MSRNLKIEINPEEIIAAVKKMKKSEPEDFLEDLLAATSPEYLASIKEARTDYRAGRTQTHEELFWRLKHRLIYTQRAIRDIKKLEAATGAFVFAFTFHPSLFTFHRF